MFVPPLLALLRGEPTPAPFYASTKVLNSEWIKAVGPSSIYFPSLNKTIVSWYMVGNGSDKGVQIAAYDHATNTWSERYKAGNYTGLADDDHGQTSICQDSSGFFYIFYGSHATTQPWSISTAANDITSWTKQTSLSGSQSYPHVVFVGTKIFAFFRNDTVTARRTFDVRSATPSSGTAAFSALSAIIDLGADSRAYMSEVRVVGTDIHFSGTRANSADTARKGIYYFIYDTITGAVKNHDSSVTVASGSLPVDLTTADASFRLFDHGTGQGDMPSLCFDSLGDPHIIFADNGGSGTSFTLKYIKRTGTTWSAPVSVDSVFAHFPGIGSITTYAVVPGAAGTVEAWYIGNAGDKKRRIRSSSGTFGAIQTVVIAGSHQLVGSHAVRDAHPSFRTVFCEASDDFTDAGAIISKRYGFGDSGPITSVIPMAVQDSLYSSVSLLMGFESRDGTTQVINESDTCFSGTPNGNAQSDTSQFKFGSSSLLLDGTGDYVTFPHNTLFSVSNGDFCVEGFIRRNGSSKLQAVATKRPNSGSSEWACYLSVTSTLTFQAFNTSVAVLAISGTTVLSAGVWYHVAYTRSGTTWRVFLDGILEASGTESGTPSSNTQLLHIGRDPSNAARDFNGWIDEFRFTSGSARYTANFTPPAQALPRR